MNVSTFRHRVMAVLVGALLATMGVALAGSLTGCERTGPGTSPGESQLRAKVPTIGYLTSFDPEWPAPMGQPYVQIFLEALRELGYVDRQNVTIEYRFASGDFDQLAGFAADLVQLPVDVMVLADSRPIRYVREATTTIPAVMVVTSDPHLQGLVASLRRPGGNLTGLSISTMDLDAKRLELLKESLPRAARVAVLWEKNAIAELEWKEARAAAEVLGLELRSLEVRGPEDLEPALELAVADGADAVFVFGSPGLNAHTARIASLALSRSMPLVGPTLEWVDAGALLTYTPTRSDLFRRAAGYVDKILKGASPSELPIEQPMRFDLAINMTTAEALALDIPPSVLSRTTHLIR